jgi:hypothetical protein
VDGRRARPAVANRSLASGGTDFGDCWFGCRGFVLLTGLTLVGVSLNSRRSEAAFSVFLGEVEPRLRQALVATYGPVDGREATVDALSWAWEHWDRLGDVANPAGYLFRVGQRRCAGSHPDRCRLMCFEHPPRGCRSCRLSCYRRWADCRLSSERSLCWSTPMDGRRRTSPRCWRSIPPRCAST